MSLLLLALIVYLLVIIAVQRKAIKMLSEERHQMYKEAKAEEPVLVDSYRVKVEKDYWISIPNPVTRYFDFEEIISKLYKVQYSEQQDDLKENPNCIESRTSIGYYVEPTKGVTLCVPDPRTDRQMFDWVITEIFHQRVPR